MDTKKNARQAFITMTKVEQELQTQIFTRRKSTKGKSNIHKTRMSENHEKLKN